ncbi:MAG: DUF4126 domain-containing protein [marine benthic group bacterium]|nr:DUF4126 domain-containing protein [Gemmatimonadota bacterium]MCL7968184.1 DUF4126 domain-containing protein [Gemmatimonadota bacterium]MCL7975266.1 DUF4126 domain-containing protein [Gemmatimonadota bacterium]MCL7982258.1 DUF4126 domain-containing protein [Gemmatimonadota bacterium]MCL7984645.1 DUF4126 domain-containing protein [Gemmatimonadota bacterium]
MEWVVSLFAGVGLAAATGFRVFVPLLGMSVAAKMGILTLSPGFDWLSSPVAMVALAIATVLEVGTYFVPWLDNAMDTIATPAAVGAGTVAALSVLGDGSPFLAWVLAIIAGGGTAGVVHAGTAGARAVSTASTGGVANPALALGELVASVSMTVISILVPIVAGVLVIVLLGWAARRIRAWRARGASGSGAAASRPGT